MSTRSIWIGESSFEHVRRVRASVEDARALFGDVHGWVKMQPLVLALDELPGEAGMYRVTERVIVGGLPVRSQYRAWISPGPDGVRSEAWSKPAVHLRNWLGWKAEGDELALMESVHVEAPRPLLAFVTRTAQRAHGTMLDRVVNALAERARERGG
ncbi:MAG: hypothetical protein R3B70_09625 [Polyangiaceae bacterium]